MASLLSGTNPTYDDYLVSGIMIHSPSPRLFLAIKNQGCFLVDVQSGAKTEVVKRMPKELSSRTPIELDFNWKPFKTLFDKKLPFNLICPFFSQAAHTARFLDGTIDVELEWTRKGNLEQAVSYGLVKEVGGVMVTPDGVSIGGERFKTFRQEGHFPLIIATDQKLAMAVSRNLKQQGGALLDIYSAAPTSTDWKRRARGAQGEHFAPRGEHILLEDQRVRKYQGSGDLVSFERYFDYLKNRGYRRSL